ncbi:MAG: phosphohistidine phosphatase SixA [Spongiibacteraceae bacterium]
MNILIMRHGEAETYAESDAKRSLTELGCQQARLAGECLQQLDLSFDQVWVSPYIRAQQTADELLSGYGQLRRKVCEHLEPDAKISLIIDLLAACGKQNILLVSHQPLVSSLISMLESGNTRSGPPMSPASMALLSADILLPGCSQLQWLRHAPNFQSSR